MQSLASVRRQIHAGFLHTFVAWNGPRHTSPVEARLAAQTLLHAAREGDEDAADTGIEFMVFLLMRTTDSEDKLAWLQTVFNDESLDVIFGLLEQATLKSKKTLSLVFADFCSRTTSKSRPCHVDPDSDDAKRIL